MTNVSATFQTIDFPSLFVLMLSVIFIFGSILEIISKRYRRELREKVIAELPEGKKYFESKQGIEAARRRRLGTLLLGIALLFMWLFFIRFLI
jgi:hypothetical protein